MTTTTFPTTGAPIRVGTRAFHAGTYGPVAVEVVAIDTRRDTVRIKVDEPDTPEFREGEVITRTRHTLTPR